MRPSKSRVVGGSGKLHAKSCSCSGRGDHCKIDPEYGVWLVFHWFGDIRRDMYSWCLVDHVQRAPFQKSDRTKMSDEDTMNNTMLCRFHGPLTCKLSCSKAGEGWLSSHTGHRQPTEYAGGVMRV